MGEIGKIVCINGGNVTVSLTRSEACSKCRACIAGMQKNEMLLQAKNTCGAVVDDWVEIELERRHFIKAVLILYGIPFLAMILGFVLGFAAGRTMGMEKYEEIIGFMAGMCFLLGAYGWIRFGDKRLDREEWTPSAVRVVQK